MKSQKEIKMIENEAKREHEEEKKARQIVEEAKRTNLKTHLRRKNIESK